MSFLTNMADFDAIKIIELLGVSGFIILVFFLSLKMFARNVLERRILLLSLILLCFGIASASIYFDFEESKFEKNIKEQSMVNVDVGGGVKMTGADKQTIHGGKVKENVTMESTSTTAVK